MNSSAPVISIGTLVARSCDSRATSLQRERAFAEIVRRFQDMAFGLAFAILGDAPLAEDAAQEAFLLAWRELDNLREPEAFPGWFKQIVRTQCNRLTRNKKLPSVSYEASPAALGAAATDRSADPVWCAERQEMTGTVYAALAALPDHERLATTLYYLGDHDQAAIAAFLGVPVTTIKKRIFSARQRLRERIGPYMTSEPTPEERTVGDVLQARRPSRTERFSDTVRLWRALEDNDAPALAGLLDKQAKALLSVREPETNLFPLHVAVRRGYLACVEALLARGADPAAICGEEGMTPLHVLAAHCARIEIAEKLMAAGADVNARDARGRTPLYLAARATMPAKEDTADHWGLCEFLIARGATVDLHSAAALDRPQEVGETVEAAQLAQRDPDEGGTPLHWAARAGYRRVTRALLCAGADVHATDNAGRTPLRWAALPGKQQVIAPHRSIVDLLAEKGAKADIFTAALLNDTGRVEALARENPALVNARDAEGATPLMLAAWTGARGVVEHLLARGADVNARDTDGRTAMTIRYGAGSVFPDVRELLLAAGATADLKTALALGRDDLVQAALARGTDAAATSDLLEWAVSTDLPTAKLLLPFERGAAREIVYAAALGMTDAVRAILDADPDAVRRRNGGRNTAMHRAAGRGHRDTVQLLLERGASINAVADDGGTPLHRAIVGGHAALVPLLLERGADPALCNHRGESPLCLAAGAGDAGAVALLLERGASPSEGGAGKHTPLHLAAEKGYVAVVRALLAGGADIEARNYYSATPLHVAVREGHSEIVSLLLAVGADKLARDAWYRTPLHVAAWFDQEKAATLLLDAGMSVGELSYGFSTVLHTAAEKGSRRVAELLLARGANVNAQSDFGRTPLHDAVHGNQYDLARLLLAHGANPNVQNNRGMAPLHWAAAAGKTDLIRLLLEHGADPSLLSHKEETPLQIAARHEEAEAERLLHSLLA